MLRLAVCLQCLLAVWSVALADPQCTVETAFGQIQLNGTERRARSAAVALPVLMELQQIISKATDPTKPVIDQLSTRDAARHATIISQFSAMQVSEFVESAYERDASVMEKMWDAAWKSYNDPIWNPPTEDIAGSLVFLLRSISPQPLLTEFQPQPNQCTIEEAIVVDEKASLDRIASLVPMMDRYVATMYQLREKYKIQEGTPFDFSKVLPSDMHTLQQMNAEAGPVRRERTLAFDLQNMRDWWGAATLQHQTRREDITTYGPDSHNLDTTIRRMFPKLDERSRAMLALWSRIDKQVKSQAVIDMQTMNKTGQDATPAK
jgi:hypothetical protein